MVWAGTTLAGKSSFSETCHDTGMNADWKAVEHYHNSISVDK